MSAREPNPTLFNELFGLWLPNNNDPQSLPQAKLQGLREGRQKDPLLQTVNIKSQ